MLNYHCVTTLTKFTQRKYHISILVLHFTEFVHFRSLTEKIVAVLPKMKCPHRIEPHQIQGLDFIHIYPVVQV